MSRFRSNLVLRIGNRVVSLLVRAHLPMGRMALLTVSGRKSGLPRTTPVALAPYDSGWRLVSPYGVVDWVKNLRVAGSAVLVRKGSRITVKAEEIEAEQAARLIRQAMQQASPLVRKLLGPYFRASIDAPIEQWIAEAARHPVFVLRPVSDHPVSTDG